MEVLISGEYGKPLFDSRKHPEKITFILIKTGDSPDVVYLPLNGKGLMRLTRGEDPDFNKIVTDFTTLTQNKL